MAAAQTISASEFKAKCLNILDRLDNHQLDGMIITKRGRTVAVLTPPDQLADAVRNIHGFMRGSVIIADEVDLTGLSWTRRSPRKMAISTDDRTARGFARYLRCHLAGERREAAAGRRVTAAFGRVNQSLMLRSKYIQ
jgi:hypothetical protein